MNGTLKLKAKVSKRANYKDISGKYKLFSDLMECTTDVIYFKDRKGRLLMVNRAHAKGLGLKPEEVVGKTDFDFFPKERARKMFEDDMRVIKTGKPIIDKVERATRPDGIDNYVSTTKIPRYDGRGKVVGLIGITRDITHRMQLESVREERDRIKKKLETLEEMNRLTSEFVSVVSHELRTPLAIIKESVSLIFDEILGPVNPKQKSMLVKTRNNIERLRGTIEDLLDISRVQRGKLRLHYSLVNLNDFLLELFESFNMLAQEKNLHLSCFIPEEQINIFLDLDRINQVVSNLITNAIKFTEENGKIKLEVKIFEDRVRVGIIDSGIGIAKEDVSRLFNKFVQVSKSENTSRKGLGLGLSIVKELVGLHGGDIWAESRLGVGSKFYFTLPRLYSTRALDKFTREKINSFLRKGTTVYLVNLLIVNFKNFQKKLKVDPSELFKHLEAVMGTALKDFSRPKKEPPQIVAVDNKFGEYHIVFPEAGEKEAADLCEALKEKIKKYLALNKLPNVFINIGVLPYYPVNSRLKTQQLFANLYVKKIYIGSEIRRFRRVEYRVEINTLYPDKSRKVNQLLDISQGGVSFFCHEKLKKNALVKINLKVPGRKGHIYTQGRVTRVKKVGQLTKKEDARYRVGLEFVNLRRKDQQLIAKYIESSPL